MSSVAVPQLSLLASRTAALRIEDFWAIPTNLSICTYLHNWAAHWFENLLPLLETYFFPREHSLVKHRCPTRRNKGTFIAENTGNASTSSLFFSVPETKDFSHIDSGVRRWLTPLDFAWAWKRGCVQRRNDRKTTMWFQSSLQLFPQARISYSYHRLWSGGFKGFSIFSATFQQLLGLGTSDKQAKFKWRSCLHSQYLPKISWWLRPKRRLQLVADHLISRHLISRPEKEKAAFLVHGGMVPAMGQIV